MPTSRFFNDMLNEHLSYDLLKAEILKRDWLLQHVQRDDGWKGGTLPVPFQGSRGSTVKFGGLAGQTDIDQPDYKRGVITTQREMWGSILFEHRDLIEHDGKVSEKSFLKVLPEVLDDFLGYMKERASLNLLNGAAAVVSVDGTAGGDLAVSHPERFTIGEKLFVDDDDTATSVATFVRTINLNTNVLTLFDARSGGAAVNLSAYTVAQNAKVYFDGSEPGTDEGFQSIRAQILPASAGGSSALFGVTKTDFPYTQSIVADGSSITATNIVEKIFNHYVDVLNKGSGKPSTVVLSYKNLAAVMKALENNPFNKGQYHIDQTSRKVTAYGWGEIYIMGPVGELKLVSVQEVEDDVIYFLDMKGIKFHTNGFFRKRVAPDGKSYFELRTATGYQYIVDVALYGELVVNRPRAQGALHSIDFVL